MRYTVSYIPGNDKIIIEIDKYSLENLDTTRKNVLRIFIDSEDYHTEIMKGLIGVLSIDIRCTAFKSGTGNLLNKDIEFSIFFKMFNNELYPRFTLSHLSEDRDPIEILSFNCEPIRYIDYINGILGSTYFKDRREIAFNVNSITENVSDNQEDVMKLLKSDFYLKSIHPHSSDYEIQRISQLERSRYELKSLNKKRLEKERLIFLNDKYNSGLDITVENKE